MHSSGKDQSELELRATSHYVQVVNLDRCYGMLLAAAVSACAPTDKRPLNRFSQHGEAQHI